MSYATDCAKSDADIKEAYRLYEIYNTTKSEEDLNKWYKAVTSVHHRKYLRMNLTIWPTEDIKADKIKELLENNEYIIKDNNLYYGDKIIAEIIESKVSTWPKPAIKG